MYFNALTHQLVCHRLQKVFSEHAFEPDHSVLSCLRLRRAIHIHFQYTKNTWS